MCVESFIVIMVLRFEIDEKSLLESWEGWDNASWCIVLAMN